MKTSFALQQAQAQLGIKKLRKHQIEPIQSILNGYDTMVIAPTSAGKSADGAFSGCCDERSVCNGRQRSTWFPQFS